MFPIGQRTIQAPSLFIQNLAFSQPLSLLQGAQLASPGAIASMAAMNLSSFDVASSGAGVPPRCSGPLSPPSGCSPELAALFQQLQAWLGSLSAPTCGVRDGSSGVSDGSSNVVSDGSSGVVSDGSSNVVSDGSSERPVECEARPVFPESRGGEGGECAPSAPGCDPSDPNSDCADTSSDSDCSCDGADAADGCDGADGADGCDGGDGADGGGDCGGDSGGDGCGGDGGDGGCGGDGGGGDGGGGCGGE